MLHPRPPTTRKDAWYVQAAVSVAAAPVITRREAGAVGADINPLHADTGEVDRFGNPLLRRCHRIPLRILGRTHEQVRAGVSEAPKAVVAQAQAAGARPSPGVARVWGRLPVPWLPGASRGWLQASAGLVDPRVRLAARHAGGGQSVARPARGCAVGPWTRDLWDRGPRRPPRARVRGRPLGCQRRRRTLLSSAGPPGALNGAARANERPVCDRRRGIRRWQGCSAGGHGDAPRRPFAMMRNGSGKAWRKVPRTSHDGAGLPAGMMPGAPRSFGPEDGAAGGTGLGSETASRPRTPVLRQEPPPPLFCGVGGWLRRRHGQRLAAAPATDQRAVTQSAANRDHFGLRLVLWAPHRRPPLWRLRPGGR